MDEEMVLGFWTPLANQEDIDDLMKAFDNFDNSVLVDLKYFSANKVAFPQPSDPSQESHCYVKFQSFSPNIAENPNRNEIVMKFTGIDQININSSKFDQGQAQDVSLQFSKSGAIILAVDTQNNIDLEDDEKTTPTFIIADSVGWSYDYGDDER